MTTRSAGNANQRWVADWLTERGWTVANFPVRNRPLFKKGKIIYVRLNQDVWGADLMARKKMNPGDIYILWIQVAVNRGVKKRVDEFKKYFQFLLPGEHLQLWTKTGTTWNVKEIPIREGAEPMELGKIIRRKWYSACGWEF
jgi:hypothetical protein